MLLGDNVFWGMVHSKNRVKELEVENDKLRAENKELKAEIEELKKRISELEYKA
jgi:cell division protein FtsB